MYKCNEFISNGDNNVIFKQNTDTFMEFKTDGKMEIKRFCAFTSSVAFDVSGSLSIVKRPLDGFQILDFTNTYGVGKHRFVIASNTIFEMTTTEIKATRSLECDAGIKTNTITTDGDNNLLFQRNGSSYMTFNTDKVEICQPLHLANELVLDTSDLLNMKSSLESGVYIYDIRNDQATSSMIRFRIGGGGGGASSIIMQIKGTEVIVSQDLVMSSTKSVKTNIIDTTTDSDLVFKRNAIEYMRFQGSDATVRMNYSLVSTNTYIDNHRPTSYGVDTFYYGNNSTDDGYKEYFRFNHASESCDFNVPIDNSGLKIRGNMVDTTPSDERLKTNIEDVESNFTECVKNVKVKTFEYTDEKYKDNDNYGFIAQQLREHLPKEFKNSAKETKDKHINDKFLSIKYMKLSVVLWGAVQETLTKVEHLESSVYELQEELKEVKKPKAKAKSKAKAEQ